MVAAKKKKKAKAVKSKKIGTRRSTLKRSNLNKKRSPKRFDILFLWVKRLGVIFIALVILSWAAVWFFLSDADINSSNWVRERTVAVLANSGFSVENILVEGRVNSDPDILLALINIEKGDPIFSFQPNEAKNQIEKIGWIKSARVERRLPDTIYISIVERKPLALWRNKDALYLIDNDGEVISSSDLNKFKDLIMVSGDGSNMKASKFIALLNAEEKLKSMVNNAKLIDNRRWDLYLHGGKLIKLPENDMGLAIKNIMFRHEQNDILNSDSVAVIDARYQGRLIISTKLGKVQDYRAELEH